MYSTISIKNFRGINSLEATGLRPINLILGRNNSGKTAFLESLFLLGGLTDPPPPTVLPSLPVSAELPVPPVAESAPVTAAAPAPAESAAPPAKKAKKGKAGKKGR